MAYPLSAGASARMQRLCPCSPTRVLYHTSDLASPDANAGPAGRLSCKAHAKLARRQVVLAGTIATFLEARSSEAAVLDIPLPWRDWFPGQPSPVTVPRYYNRSQMHHRHAPSGTTHCEPLLHCSTSTAARGIIRPHVMLMLCTRVAITTPLTSHHKPSQSSTDCAVNMCS